MTTLIDGLKFGFSATFGWLAAVALLAIGVVILSLIYGFYQAYFVPPRGHGEICARYKKPINAYKEKCFFHCQWWHSGDCTK